MQIVARFNSGKRLNLIQRGSFQRRATLSGLRYNQGAAWQRTPWKTLFEESPGKHFQRYMDKQMNSGERKKVNRRLFPEEATLRKKRGDYESMANIEYGPNAEEAELEPVEMKAECERLLQKLQVSIPLFLLIMMTFC